MNTTSNAEPGVDVNPAGRNVAMPPRPLYWSVRREIWENRSIYIAPVIMASFALFGTIVNLIRLPQKLRTIGTLTASKQQHVVMTPFDTLASITILTAFVVGVFYCLDALSGERRDRSILFWKSMPVSDRTTVFSKALVPLAVLPLLAYVIALVSQLILATLSTMVVAGSGINPGMFWSRLPLVQTSFVMFYGMAAHVLWFAPIYAWLLLVSAWARRAAVVWAILPFLAVVALEKMALGTGHFVGMIKYRFAGAMIEAFTVNAAKQSVSRISQLAPLKFLSAPGLWFGLLFAAVCIAAAIRLRRNREAN